MIKVIIFLLLFVGTAQATIYYVASSGGDNSRSCGTASNIATPKLTIANGIACAILPDDILDIRTGTYDETVAVFPAAGLSGHPIIIRGHVAELVTWKRTGQGKDAVGSIMVIDKGYIRFSNITFADTDSRIPIDFGTTPKTGIEFVNCTFSNLGNRGVLLDATADGARDIRVRFADLTKITGCAFTGNYGWAIDLANTVSNSLIDSNTAIGQKSTAEAFGTHPYHSRFVQIDHGASKFNTISNNVIHSFEQDSYAAGGSWSANAVKMDTGASFNTVSDNEIYDFDTADANVNVSSLLNAESGCNDNLFLRNRLYNSHARAIIFGSPSTGKNQRNTADHNTIFGCTCGISVVNAGSGTIKNNIIYINSGTGPAIQQQDISSGIVYKNNDYYNSGSSSIGRWNNTNNAACPPATSTLSAWASSSGDTNSLNANPTFVDITAPGFDFNLIAGSPAIHAADDGSDMGYVPFGNPPPAATITLVYPNGDEDLVTGQSVPITWITTQAGNCSVELNRGAVWETLSASITCTAQTFSWTVTPPGLVNTALFRVTSLNTPTITDTSDAVAHIHGSRVVVRK